MKIASFNFSKCSSMISISHLLFNQFFTKFLKLADRVCAHQDVQLARSSTANAGRCLTKASYCWGSHGGYKDGGRQPRVEPHGQARIGKVGARCPIRQTVRRRKISPGKSGLWKNRIENSLLQITDNRSFTERVPKVQWELKLQVRKSQRTWYACFSPSTKAWLICEVTTGTTVEKWLDVVDESRIKRPVRLERDSILEWRIGRAQMYENRYKNRSHNRLVEN